MVRYEWETKVKLEDIFDNYINVPEYQREYSWGLEEAGDFFNDLKTFSADPNDDEYLFGQFIFYRDQNKNKLDVIDGQQRLVTTVIFVSVARNIVDKLNVNYKSQKYNQFSTWVFKVIGSNEDDDYKLTLNGKGKSYFLKYVQHQDVAHTAGKYKATKNIYSVFKYFEEQINKNISDLESDSEQFDYIYGLLKSLLQHFFLSVIKTDNLSQAYIIFETLNARGKDLEASDLLKNHFFHLAGSEIKDEWEEFSSTIDNAGDSITQFIRVYWNSQYKLWNKDNTLVRQRKVYREISSNIRDKTDVIRLVDGLSRTSNYYLSMVNPTSFDAFNDKKIQAVLINLKILSTKLYYPIVIACVERGISDKDILRLLQSIESLTVRNIIIGPDNANQYEESFCEYANRLSLGEDVCNIIEDIKYRTHSDEKFQHSFAIATIKDTSVSRYILASIYNYENGPENIINPNSSTVNVEHIMPKTLGDNWKSIITDADHESFLNYIGNQTLLTAEDNSKNSNNSFSDKKSVYVKSKIPQNHYFDNILEWDIAEIEKRQNQLYLIAVKRWKK